MPSRYATIGAARRSPPTLGRVSVPTASDIGEVRQRFAEEIRHRAQVRTEAPVSALASPPRERFLGDGP